MNIDIPDEVISKLIDAEIKASISRRVTDVMNNGKAHWFSEFNIQNETRLAIRQMISEYVHNAVVDSLNKIDYKVLSEMIGKTISECIMCQVFDISGDED